MFGHSPVQSLVSVVIPCYNHGQYLPRAIESVLQQSHAACEIIVVDDGSTDNTREVAQSYSQVRYVYQQNSGLSASRNTGIDHSTGEYLVFLDADDWLYPDAVATNLHYLQQNESAAFVSGGYNRVYKESNTVEEKTAVADGNHYCLLLEKNYIGMIAAVLFRRWVFDEFRYDTTLRACEDYDLYLRITRKYPVLHHTQKISAYYIHSANMSANNPMMLSIVLKVLKRQKKLLQTSEEKAYYKKGMALWKKYYCIELYRNLKLGNIKANKEILKTFLKYRPRFLVQYAVLKWLR